MIKPSKVEITDTEKGLYIYISRKGESDVAYPIRRSELIPLIVALEDYLEAQEVVK